MLDKVLETLNNNFKLSTAVQVGMDDEVCHILPNIFWHTIYYDYENDKTIDKYHSIVENESTDIEPRFFTQEEDFMEDIKYHQLTTDFIYIHNRVTKDFSHRLFRYFSKNRTLFMLTHPDVITNDCSYYQKLRFASDKGDFILFYLDVLYESLGKDQIYNNTIV